MFEKLAEVVLRRGWIVVLAWLGFAATLWYVAPSWETVSRDDDVRFFPAGYPSVVGQEILTRGFPRDASGSQAVLIFERRGGRLTEADFAYADSITDALARMGNDPLDAAAKALDEQGERRSGNEVRYLKGIGSNLGVKQVMDHRTLGIGPRLVGTAREGPGQAALTIVSLAGTYLSKQTRITVDAIGARLRHFKAPPEGLALGLTGSAAVGRDQNNASNTSVAATTYTTIGLVIVILLFVYRSPLLALLPLASIALSVVVSLWAIAALTRVPGLNFQVINITNVFVIVVLFGAGTDYCLFLIARYREELARGRTGDDALREAIVQVGGALVASAGTVICGLGMLYFSSFAKIQYTGPSIALSLAISLLAALTLSPVLLHWLRGAVFWPFQTPHHVRGADREAEAMEQIPMSGIWAVVAEVVVRRPGAILAASVLLLLPFAVIGARTTPNYSQLADLSPDQPSVLGSRSVERYFSVGELGPTGVMLDDPTRDFRSESGRAALESLCVELAALPDISEVRSASRPLGQAPPASPNFAQRLVLNTTRAVADQRYIASIPTATVDRNHITRVDLVLKEDPFSDAALDSLEAVRRVVSRATAPGGVLAGANTSGLVGATAMIRDLKAVTTLDERRMYVFVTLGVYVILVALLRRPGICLYLIATVVLGYLASLGATELVFKALHRGPEAWVGLDWKVGFFLFVILVAVGEDYNIFLMARVIEEEKKHGPVEGTRHAVAHTGGIISSCGLIMAGTFGSMLTGSLTALRELGFALGLGVLLDTFIVRPILVPAFVVLLHRNRPGDMTPIAEAPMGEPAESVTAN